MLIASFLIVLLVSFAFAGHAKDALAMSNKGTMKKVRVISSSDEEIAEAKERGCDSVRETKKLKALICPSEVAASLDLQEDIIMVKADVVANSQVGADIVHAEGNTGQGRRVVVLDTGYNYNHPDLASSYLGGRDFVNNDGDPMDDDGHGTIVAGLITSDGLNSAAKGAAPDVGIIVGKVLDSQGSGFFSDVVAGIYWAVDGPDGVAGTKDDFKPDAINLSIGTSAPFVYKGYCNSKMPEMTKAIKYAVDRGVIVVVAAGNLGTSGVSIPGCISYALTVGAVDSNDKVASFSGRGKAVDVVAPGSSLISTWHSMYASSSGTSLATPIVTAAVAMIKHESPSLSALRIQNILYDTAVDLGKTGRDNNYGYGRLDVPEAVG
jgi:subtilisin family serine protease